MNDLESLEMFNKNWIDPSLDTYPANEAGCRDWLSKTDYKFSESEFNSFYKTWIRLKMGSL